MQELQVHDDLAISHQSQPLRSTFQKTSALLCREFIDSRSRVRGKGTTRKELTSPLRGGYMDLQRSIRAAPLF